MNVVLISENDFTAYFMSLAREKYGAWTKEETEWIEQTLNKLFKSAILVRENKCIDACIDFVNESDKELAEKMQQRFYGVETTDGSVEPMDRTDSVSKQ